MVREIVVDIGCGENKVPGSIGVDIRRYRGVDVVCNLEHRLPFGDGTIDTIWCRHVLEHVLNLELVMAEFKRVLKERGNIYIVVPHFSNSLAYSDYTHRRFFGYYTFDYCSSKKSKYWWVPTYVSADALFWVKQKHLIFRNFGVFGKLIERMINRSEFTAYLYEAKFSWMIPCFEIYVCLVKAEV